MAKAGRPLLLSAALLGAGLAGAQITLGRLNLAGASVQSITLYGADYASAEVLGGVVRVTRDLPEVPVTVEGTGPITAEPAGPVIPATGVPRAPLDAAQRGLRVARRRQAFQ